MAKSIRKTEKEKTGGKVRTYTVLNPRGIPAGRHIFTDKARTRQWFEGDELDPADMPGMDVASWIAQGFLSPRKG